MKKLIAIVGLLVMNQVFAQTWTTDEQYIQNFAKYAVEEMEKFKIPASITLAQGLLETGGGQSRLAKQGNNHFGIKCKKEWKGKSMKHTDDAPHECFRVYDSPRDSYTDHSKFLAYRPYYKKLFKLKMRDYKAWAHGLKKAGYATNRRYAYILISKIEKYNLNKFDYATSKNVDEVIAKMFPNLKEKQEAFAKVKIKKEKLIAKVKKVTPPPAIKKVHRAKEKKKELTKYQLLRMLKVKEHPNKGVEYIVISGSNLKLKDIAKKYGVKERRLLKYNDLSSSILKKGQVVFLESKKSRGLVEKYKVKAGDTMHLISQQFAIKLRKLYRRNRMKAGQPLKVGQILKLK